MKTVLKIAFVLAMLIVLAGALAFDLACGWDPVEQSGED